MSSLLYKQCFCLFLLWRHHFFKLVGLKVLLMWWDQLLKAAIIPVVGCCAQPVAVIDQTCIVVSKLWIESGVAFIMGSFDDAVSVKAAAPIIEGEFWSVILEISYSICVCIFGKNVLNQEKQNKMKLVIPGAHTCTLGPCMRKPFHVFQFSCVSQAIPWSLM